MARAYRVSRGVLAALALAGLLLFTAWHALMWRMRTVYVAEGGVPAPWTWKG